VDLLPMGASIEARACDCFSAACEKLFSAFENLMDPQKPAASATDAGGANPADSSKQRLEEIFHSALERAIEDRASFLAEATSGDADLQEQVKRLLLAFQQSEELFEKPFTPEIERELARLKPEEEGERIGRYKLLQEIGQGGFGTVWMAEQLEPLSRRVALKIIKLGMDTREVIGRFEQERQALAMMDHPNIAQVFDAGSTPFGRPYFVMELVKGIQITEFCDERQLDTQQRLELFGDVCSAINHAHQKGVIHCDIKPSNVMITLHGDKPVVKVIDFGVAKATQGKLTDKTLFTRFEQFIGTPAYMSPEQTAMSGLDIDTRSDIYALGILLYELLTGKPPFDAKTLASAGHEEMRRIIREVEPSRPSLRLSTVAGDERTHLARARRVASEKLNRTVRPDLDWIVMKAIEKDRERRYETANGLALDIQRFLANEPVSAGPPTARYRFSRFVRRNRVALRVAGAIATVLIGATVVSMTMAIRALKAEKQANQKATEEAEARKLADAARLDADSLSRFFARALQRGDPEHGGREMTVVDAVKLAIKDLDDEISRLSENEVELRRNSIWTLHKLGFTHEIIPLQEKVRDFYLSKFGPQHAKSLDSSLNLAFYISRDRGTEGGIEKATRILEQLTEYENVWPPEKIREWFQTLTNLRQCYRQLNRFEEAVKISEKALETCRRLYTSDSEATLKAMTDLATVLSEAGRHQEAIAIRTEALEIQRKTSGPLHPQTLVTIHHLANLYHNAGNLDKALKLREDVLPQFREVLGLRNADTLMAMHNFAESCFEAGRKAEATKLLEEVVALRPDVSGPTHVDTLEAMHDLATCYFDAGRAEEALALRELVLPLRRELLGKENPDTLEAMTNLAVSLNCAGRQPESFAVQEEALAIARRVLPPNHPFRQAALTHMAWLCEMTGLRDECEVLRKELPPQSVPAIPRPNITPRPLP
jgi:serine/threonine protein kinase/tetratricopeptide (TPR) repeat protein